LVPIDTKLLGPLGQKVNLANLGDLAYLGVDVGESTASVNRKSKLIISHRELNTSRCALDGLRTSAVKISTKHFWIAPAKREHK
jgi:hypothetical protein